MTRPPRTPLLALAATLAAGAVLLAAAALRPGPADAAPAGLPGVQVSGLNGSVNWSAAWTAGARFAYIQATEGTSVSNASFAQQYNGSYSVGMIRGAYHVARPDLGGGAAQADWFVAHGGGWSRDGRTLPGALDIEYNPYGATCYGLSQSAMRSWITAFVNRYQARTGRWATIYTTADWWATCTGNYAGFTGTNPLWLARYANTVGTVPAGWATWSFWQWASSGALPGEQNVWNGSLDRLRVLACDGPC
ncbi:lysozyme [Micromonospora sp. LZ34]